jgi:hypothetical protein
VLLADDGPGQPPAGREIRIGAHTEVGRVDVAMGVEAERVGRREALAQVRGRRRVEHDGPRQGVQAAAGMGEVAGQPVGADDAVGVGVGEPRRGRIASDQGVAHGGRSRGARPAPRPFDHDGVDVGGRHRSGARGGGITTAIGGDHDRGGDPGALGGGTVDGSDARRDRRELVASGNDDDDG